MAIQEGAADAQYLTAVAIPPFGFPQGALPSSVVEYRILRQNRVSREAVFPVRDFAHNAASGTAAWGRKHRNGLRLAYRNISGGFLNAQKPPLGDPIAGFAGTTGAGTPAGRWSRFSDSLRLDWGGNVL